MTDVALAIPKESAKAAQAFADYVALGPGRSLEKLLDFYRNGAESCLTTRLNTLKFWSAEYDWQQRLRNIAAEQLEYASGLHTDTYVLISGEYHRRVSDEAWRKSMALNALHGIYDRVKPPIQTQSAEPPGTLVVRLEIVPPRQQD